jgi:phage-related minor tail protein
MDSKSLNVVALSGFLGVFLGATSVLAAATYASHPFLHRAQRELRSAKGLLQRATHDCGGHRTAAIQKLDAAISEVDLAVTYADAHPQEESKQAH